MKETVFDCAWLARPIMTKRQVFADIYCIRTQIAFFDALTPALSHRARGMLKGWSIGWCNFFEGIQV